MLSASTVNSGGLLHRPPTKRYKLRDSQLVQLGRLRLGLPPLLPPQNWTCRCVDHGGPIDPDFHEVEAMAERKTFADNPLHGLQCRSQWLQVCHRHNALSHVIVSAMNRIEGVSATYEPMLQPAANLRRADVRVNKNGVTYFLDVVVTSVAAACNINQHHSDSVPGAAAEARYRYKLAKYADTGVSNVHPIAIESGGRIHPKSCEALDAFFDTHDAQQLRWNMSQKHKMYRQILFTLMIHQSLTLSRIAASSTSIPPRE